MREIKFRAWDKARKKFADYGAVHLDGSIMARSATFGGLHDFVPEEMSDRIVLQQYTGLKDKNGREVFEGDLVAPTGGYEDGECEHPSEVHWNEYNLQWEALCKTCAYAVPLGEFDLHSVVGNVWES